MGFIRVRNGKLERTLYIPPSGTHARVTCEYTQVVLALQVATLQLAPLLQSRSLA